MRRLAEALRLHARLILRAAWRALVRFYNGHDFTYAASIAYWALLSLFPFLLLLFAVLGAATADEADRQAVVDFALDYFPTRVDFVTRQLDALRETSLEIGVAGAAGLVWASLGFFTALSTAVNYAWGVDAPRSFLRQRLFALLMLATAGLMFLAAVVLASAVPIVEASWFARVLSRFPELAEVRGLLAQSVSAVLPILMLGLLYYFVPSVRVRFRSVWVGAVSAGVVWRAALAGVSWYLGDLSRLSRVHGSIATVVVFLLWIYVSAAILLYGAELTAEYERLRGGAERES